MSSLKVLPGRGRGSQRNALWLARKKANIYAVYYLCVLSHGVDCGQSVGTDSGPLLIANKEMGASSMTAGN
jgi:hypothetical protein